MENESMMQPGQQIRPIITIESAKHLASELYGLNIKEIQELNAYDDKNFHISVSSINNPHITTTWQYGYVFKIMNSLDSKNTLLVEGQQEMMLFLVKNNIACPNPVLNIRGLYYSLEELGTSYKDEDHNSSKYVVRLLEFQPGILLCNTPCTKDLFFDAGRYAANLDNILKDFSHPAYKTHKSVWCLSAVPDLDKFLFALQNPEQRNLAKKVIDLFKSEVLPSLDNLEKGMIHGDFNEQNVLCKQSPDGKWKVSGILDFGDSHYSCYIFELAITICYMMLQCKDTDPIEVSGYVLAGYSTIRQLPGIEYKLLKICIMARFCQSLILGAYSYAQNPTNDYVLTTAKLGWKQLQYLWDTPFERIHSIWKEIMEKIKSQGD